MKVVAILCLVVASTAWGQDAVSGFEAQIKAGEYESAQPKLENYTLAHPESWQALYQLGYVDFRLHRIYQSVTALSKCLAQYEPFADAHKILALDLNILGRKDLAEKELLRSLALNPRSTESNYELGRIYYDEGSYLKSVQYLERARSLSPDWVKVRHNLGLAYSAVGNDTSAVHEFEEGLRLNAAAAKPSPWPQIDYGSYLNSKDKFAGAKKLLLEAVRIDDKIEQAYEELSRAYRGLGETGLAIDSLKRAAALNPAKPEYHYALARLYSQAKRSAEAQDELAAYQRAKREPVPAKQGP